MVTRNPANQIEVKPCAKCGWKREVVIYGTKAKVWVQLCSACTADKVADEAEEKVRVSRLRAESIRQKRVSRLEKRRAAWNDRANRYAIENLGFEIFELPNDPYDLHESAAAAFELGTSAERFVCDSFAEDLASQAHDDILRQESLDASVNDEEDLLDVFTDDDKKNSR